MPRVAQMPRTGGVRTTSGSYPAPSTKSPLNHIPLNDDAQEREQRMHSRKVLQEKQINEIKAAVTPRKGSLRLDGVENASPSPRSGTPRGSRNSDDDLVKIGGTPVKRVPILANFEEWMKMATDNKINATNSWNFALIDYFHDMSLLKEGDGVNFQKASCTLDGCVKIYTNRVDSVATETGKLLSGLADSNSKKKDGDGEDGDGEDSDEEVDDDGNVKKKTKKKSRSSEATLAPSFAALQLKKFELEFAVDPLFKKASADFDEGGAKGLLLNHLMIDSQGRIVFDSSDDSNETVLEKKDEQALLETGEEGDLSVDGDVTQLRHEAEATQLQLSQDDDDSSDVEIDLASLGRRYFPDLSRLDELDVCPSLKTFDLGDPSGSTDIPFLRAPEDWKQEQHGASGAFGDHSGMLFDEDAPAGFDDDDLGLGSFDLGGDVAFGEGGEAWARDAALAPQMRAFDTDMGEDGVDGEGFDDNGEFVVSVANSQTADKMHQDILSFFDQALQKNWTNAEHWRIRKIKDVSKCTGEPKKRKEKEPFEIDFASPLDSTMYDLIHTQATNNTAISLAKKDWKSKSRNLLPDDKHFSSKSLLTLFLKPKARLIQRSIGMGARKVFGPNQQNEPPVGELDEAFWAQQKAPEDVALPQGDYDANFFQDDALPFAGGDDDDDDDDDDMEFADAQEHLGAGIDAGMTEAIGGITAILNGETMANPMSAFGDTLVAATRRVRPEYVNYARVAKKVDIRRLKEEIWRGMQLETLDPPSRRAHIPTPPVSEPDSTPGTPPNESDEEPPLKFTEVMNGLSSVYPKPVLNDISTSFGFICLLHLANEKGLIINKTEDLDELEIRRDWNAEITEGEL